MSVTLQSIGIIVLETCLLPSTQKATERMVQYCTETVQYIVQPSFHPVPASMQLTNLCDIYLILCVQS
jgi:hypothetical protein